MSTKNLIPALVALLMTMAAFAVTPSANATGSCTVTDTSDVTPVNHRWCVEVVGPGSLTIQDVISVGIGLCFVNDTFPLACSPTPGGVLPPGAGSAFFDVSVRNGVWGPVSNQFDVWVDFVDGSGLGCGVTGLQCGFDILFCSDRDDSGDCTNIGAEFDDLWDTEDGDEDFHPDCADGEDKPDNPPGNDPDTDADIDDSDCHTDGNPANPQTYNPLGHEGDTQSCFKDDKGSKGSLCGNGQAEINNVCIRRDHATLGGGDFDDLNVFIGNWVGAQDDDIPDPVPAIIDLPNEKDWIGGGLAVGIFHVEIHSDETAGSNCQTDGLAQLPQPVLCEGDWEVVDDDADPTTPPAKIGGAQCNFASTAIPLPVVCPVVDDSGADGLSGTADDTALTPGFVTMSCVVPGNACGTPAFPGALGRVIVTSAAVGGVETTTLLCGAGLIAQSDSDVPSLIPTPFDLGTKTTGAYTCEFEFDVAAVPYVGVGTCSEFVIR